MAFECEHCSFRNSEVQMGGFIPEKGVRFELTVAKGDMKVRPPSRRQVCRTPPALSLTRLARLACPAAQSLSRQIVKGDTATVKVRRRRCAARCSALERLSVCAGSRAATLRWRRFRSWSWRSRLSRSAAP
jgi:hypothetical protein